MALWGNGWPSWPNEERDPTTSPPPLGEPLERGTLYKSRLTRCGPKPPRSIVESFCTPNSIKSEPPGTKRRQKGWRNGPTRSEVEMQSLLKTKFQRKTRRLKVLTSLASPSTCVSIANDKTGKTCMTCKPPSLEYYNGQLLGKKPKWNFILFYVCDN